MERDGRTARNALSITSKGRKNKQYKKNIHAEAEDCIPYDLKDRLGDKYKEYDTLVLVGNFYLYLKKITGFMLANLTKKIILISW